MARANRRFSRSGSRADQHFADVAPLRHAVAGLIHHRCPALPRAIHCSGGGVVFMADVPTWELLSAATELVMAEAGLSKGEVQTKICRAIADGTLKFRAEVGRHMIRPMH